VEPYKVYFEILHSMQPARAAALGRNAAVTMLSRGPLSPKLRRIDVIHTIRISVQQRPDRGIDSAKTPQKTIAAVGGEKRPRPSPPA
jgi:hypothetical protein